MKEIQPSSGIHTGGLVIIVVSTIALSVLSTLLLLLSPAGRFFLATATLPKESSAATSAPTVVANEENQVIGVVKQASPAVVSIIESGKVPQYVQCQTTSTPDITIPGMPSNLQQLFSFPSIPDLCQKGTALQEVSAGSGFIVSPGGYILTNNHVVANTKDEYTVVLNDPEHLGQKVTAKVLARDSTDDVAVLKIATSSTLPYLKLGDSKNLQVGHTAIAIGNALGQFDNTVSKGVVSGLSRSVSADSESSVEELRGLIQTDAAINPGNSGGPLLNLAGKVIGMNVAMANAQSIGFAVPINIVKEVYTQVAKTGKYVPEPQAFLGVRFEPVTTELAANKKLPFN